MRPGWTGQAGERPVPLAGLHSKRASKLYQAKTLWLGFFPRRSGRGQRQM